MSRANLVGQKFGRLEVIEYVGSPAPLFKAKWLCRCRCGGYAVVITGNLRSGASKSCGCLRAERTAQRNKDNATHRMFGTPEYVVWAQMKARCQDQNHPAFKDYGARGITVCPEWQSFETFFSDMGHRPTPTHSIERKDVNQGYFTDNCKWATLEEQANNKRTTAWVTYGGVRSSLAQLACRIGLRPSVLRQRIHRQGMTVEEAVETPLRRWTRHG